MAAEISVIIPLYRCERYIRDTLKSVLSQSYQNYEVILVDDGSPDASLELAEAYLMQNACPYKLVRQQNEGPGAARNAGFSAAEGNWIFFLDSDDVIQPFTFELFIHAIERFRDLDMVFSDFQSVGENDRFKTAPRNEETTLFNNERIVHAFLTRKEVLLTSGTLFRKRFLEKNHLLHCRLRWSEDVHFLWQALDCASAVLKLHCCTYNYVQHEGSIMHATPTRFMVEAYQQFRLLAQTMNAPEARRFMLPRWVLGCLHADARLDRFAAWNRLLAQMNGAEHLKELLAFPDYRVRLLAGAGLLNRRALYHLLRVS